MKKRLLSILLALCMVICLVPTSVFAESETNKKVETEQELVDALSDSSTDIITLKNDIAISTTLTVDRAVTLDVYGYMLEITGSGSVINIKSGGHLTLKDSDPTVEHRFVSDNGLWKLDEISGTETVRGGVIYGGTGTKMYYSTYGGGVLIEPGGAFTMNGGSIVGCKADGAGGGVVVQCGDANGIFTMNSGAIIGCVAESGGGVETDGGGVGEYGQFIMNGGVIEQFDTPENIYKRPATEFVARFIGFENFLELAKKQDGVYTAPDGSEFLTSMDLDCENFAGTIRPDDICLADEIRTENVLSGKIGVRTFLGKSYQYEVETSAGVLKVNMGTDHVYKEGEEIRLYLPKDKLILVRR